MAGIIAPLPHHILYCSASNGRGKQSSTPPPKKKSYQCLASDMMCHNFTSTSFRVSLALLQASSLEKDRESRTCVILSADADGRQASIRFDARAGRMRSHHAANGAKGADHEPCVFRRTKSIDQRKHKQKAIDHPPSPSMHARSTC